MIKLEDLKIGDKVYGVCSDGSGLYSEMTVEKELIMLNLHPEPSEAVICKGGVEFITRLLEKFIFRTYDEAEMELENIRLRLAKELLNSDKFLDRLYECATSSKRLNRHDEVPIYEIAIKLYKEKIINKRRNNK